MKNKFNSKPDYIAEIDLPCDKLVDSFSHILKKEYGLSTVKINHNTNQFLSKDAKHSFYKSFIKKVPAQIDWRVEQLSSTLCRISIFFSLPTWLNIS